MYILTSSHVPDSLYMDRETLKVGSATRSISLDLETRVEKMTEQV